MEWGLVMATMGLFLMVVLVLEHLDGGEGEDLIRTPLFRA